ncbi:alpha/beta fold hydrolase [Actinomadura scrupuli]|uniref:alpha/beta fold hydrolase n=1 Tax=Actinomadura scrupuli TaxID=559629 RepID=UPI003D974CA5
MVPMVSSFNVVSQLGGAVIRKGAQAAARARSWVEVIVPDHASLAGSDGPVRRRQGPARRVSFVRGLVAGSRAVKVAYERQGSGEPVVLLHGIGLHRRSWDAVVPFLTAEREVIALDLPGFGQSPDLPESLSHDLPTVVAALEKVFAALGLERPHVVGHSLGGLIALRLAQAGCARSVTAIAPAGFWNEAERRYTFAMLAAARNGARLLPETVLLRLSRTAMGRAALAGMLYGDPDSCPPEAVTVALRAMRDAAGFMATLRAGRVPGLFSGDIPDVPVTIVWGTKDRLLPGHQAARVKAEIPQARLVQLPGCGHVPLYDAPDLIARIVLTTTESGAVVPAVARGKR